MNERIIELADQAGFVYNFDHVTWLKHEKFAELIVRECATVVKDFYQEDQFTCYNAAEKIKEHFGVSE